MNGGTAVMSDGLTAVVIEDTIASCGLMMSICRERGWDSDLALFLEAQGRARYHRARMEPQGLALPQARKVERQRPTAKAA